MRSALKAVLPSVETFARTAKRTPAKKNLTMQIGQIKEALKAAERASSPSKTGVNALAAHAAKVEDAILPHPTPLAADQVK